MKPLSTTALVDAVLRHNHPDITPLQRLILVAIANCYNSKTGRCDPSWGHIETVVGCKKNSVYRAVSKAQDIGILTWVKLKYMGNRAHNSYCWTRLHPDAKPAWTGATAKDPENYLVVGRSGGRTDHSQALAEFPDAVEALVQSDTASINAMDKTLAPYFKQLGGADSEAMAAWLSFKGWTGDKAKLELEKAKHYQPFMFEVMDEDGEPVDATPIQALVADGIRRQFPDLNFEWKVDSAFKDGSSQSRYKPFTTEGN